MKALYAIVGMKHRGTEAKVAALPQGAALVLRREPTNQYDRNAVQVWSGGEHLAYLKASQIRALASRMDNALAAGHSVDFPAVLSIDGGRWPMAEVDE